MMDPASDVLHGFAENAKRKQASSFYLNGPPGSGKSQLLGRLADQLPAAMQRTHVLGPYGIRWLDVESLATTLISGCAESGFLDRDRQLPQGLDFVSAWNWFASNAEVPGGQRFAILLDLLECSQPDYALMGNLFSMLRHLEGVWGRPDFGIHFLVAGYWDEAALESYFESINTSFPYTPGVNSESWQGPGIEEVSKLLTKARPEVKHPVFGRVLFELCGGQPLVALDILEWLPANDLTLRALLRATYDAAARGAAGQRLLAVWKMLPLPSLSVLTQLLARRRMRAPMPAAFLKPLKACGAVTVDDSEPRGCYIGFSSWYVELLVRLHAVDLGIPDADDQDATLAELIPEVHALNIEAYLMIHELENAMRNFVAIQLRLRQGERSHILAHRRERLRSDRIPESGDHIEDAYQKAVSWRNEASAIVSMDVNPLIAFCSTKELAGLMRDVGGELQSGAVARIARALDDLNSIRNVVMHNQLVDVDCIERLLVLRHIIYQALDET